MKSMMRCVWLTSALAALFILPVSSRAEEDGISDWGVNDATYGLKTREAEFSQTNYTASPADWRDINIYQLFTDRFADSGTDQLASYKSSWKCDSKSYPYNRNFHHGGDWNGLKNNIPYLTGMGVKAVWISGVQLNDQGKDTNYTPYHQYHPDNYFKCDPAMGTFAELKSLIDALHAAGIYVILDVAPNHMCDKNGLTSGDSSYNSGGGTLQWWNDSNKHPAPFDNLNYFHNNGTIQCWDCDPENKKGQFKGTDDLNTDNGDSSANAAVQAILAKAFKNLIDATDCDGFRVDAIKHVDYNWIRSWAQSVRDHAAYRGKKDFIMFGELFSYSSSALASYCSDGYGFNSALFFPISQTIKGVFGDGNWTGYLGQTMNEVSQYGVGANRLVAFIDNHDLNRISLQISGTDTGNAEWKLKPALSFLYLATPVPCLYYGTEHAFNQGGHYNGSNKTSDNPDDGDWQRECMFDKGFQPGAATGNKLVATNAPLYLHIAWLNQMRNNYISLRRGTFSQLCYSGGQGQYVFKKTYGEQTAVVYFNTSDNGITTDSANVGLANTTFYDADNTNNVKVSNASGYLPGESLSGKGTKVYVNQLPSGPVASLWCSGTYAWPASGEATTTNIIYVNTEAGPTSAVTNVTAVWSSDGATWHETAMTVNTNWASTGGHWYNTTLGPFASSTNLQYVIRVQGSGTNVLWDNNNSANYNVAIKAATSIGLASTYTYPTAAKASENLYINTLVTAATNAAQTVVTLFTSLDSGVTWSNMAMLANTNWSDSRGIWFYSDLGLPTAGSVIKYYVTASNTVTHEAAMDNNGGHYYTVSVAAEQADVQVVEGTPDMAGEVFDLVTTGGAAVTQGTNGFGDFGSIYVNYDANYIYLGAAGVALPTDVDNNAYAVFVSAGTNRGADNFWYVNSTPDGLDRLHNVGFGPAIQCAILLGDIYGDANHTNFSLYHSEGKDFGQGVFATPYGTSGSPQTFAGVNGAKIIQFGAYGYNHQQASSWKAAIPLSFFGVTNAQDLGSLYLSGLMISINTNNGVNSYLSGKFLGDSCICPNTNEPPDEWGNFGTSYVSLTGRRCSLAAFSNNTYGVPEEWVQDFEAAASGHVYTATSDYDHDGQTDRQEYFAGLNPLTNDELQVQSAGNGWLGFYRGDDRTKYCTYILQTATNLNASGNGWLWKDFQTTTTTNNQLPMPDVGVSNVMMRLRVDIPDVDEPADSIRLSALPAGGSFSTSNLNVTLGVSGYNVTASTYTVQGGSAVAFSNGQVIVFGAGMTNGQTRTLTLDGGTLHGVVTQMVYTFTKTEAGLPVSWTGNVGNDPAAGSLDAGETLTVSFQTAPIGAAASAGLVYSSNGGSSWSSGSLTKGTPNASNDLWSVSLGSFAAGATIQYALVAYDSTGSNTWNNNNGANYSITVNGGGSTNGNGKFTPYSTNPTKGLYRSAGITVDGANTSGEWTTNMLIAIDMVNDDPRSLGSNWTMHEPPADITHLWACWDDTKLYLAWQFADVTDKLDPANAGSALGGRISNSSGILQFISIDTIAGAGAPSNMWAKNDRMVGTDLPDYQIGMRSDLYTAYISKSLAGVFAGDSQLGTNYFTAASAGISIARAAGCASATLLGPYSDIDTYLANTNSALTEYITSGHDTSRDSFYEMSIPLTALGISKATLEANGIGVFINVGSKSSLDTIPNDAATLNTPGVTDSNSSWEWEDSDQFTAGYARVAK